MSYFKIILTKFNDDIDCYFNLILSFIFLTEGKYEIPDLYDTS
jgi:hypothetical protein